MSDCEVACKSSCEVIVHLGGQAFRFLDFGQDVWLNELAKGQQQHLEVVSLALWRSIATDSTAIFDVGGFNGMYSLVAARNAPFAKTVAFEPMPLSYGTLVLNAMNNESVASITAVNAALGEQTCRAQISSMSGPYVMASGESLVSHGWEHTFEIDVLRLDSIWESDRCIQGWPASALRHVPDLVKIDVEGYEVAVLNGMRNTLRRRSTGPDLLVECNSAPALFEFASAIDWEVEIHYLDEAHVEIVPVSSDGSDFAAPGNYWITSRPRSSAEAIAEVALVVARDEQWGLM